MQQFLFCPLNEFSSLEFTVAARTWMLEREMKWLRPRTHETNANYVRNLGFFFAERRLIDITAHHLREYQICRQRNEILTPRGIASPWRNVPTASLVNHEVSCLALILKRAGLWALIAPWYAPLPEPSWSPRPILSEEEHLALDEYVPSDGAALAWHVATLTAHTSLAGSELRHLQVGDVVLRDVGHISEVQVLPAHAKTHARPRTVPLNDKSRESAAWLLQRARALGAVAPHHFLFPFRLKRNRWDPTRPTTTAGLRHSWRCLRRETGLRSLRPHDLRHLCITRLLEAGVEPETVRAIAGHASERMMQYYSHHRLRVKHQAVLRLLDHPQRAQASSALRA